MRNASPCFFSTSKVARRVSLVAMVGLSMGVFSPAALSQEAKAPEVKSDGKAAPAAKPLEKKKTETPSKKTSPAKGKKTMKIGDVEFEVKKATLKTNQGTIKLDLYWRTTPIAGETAKDLEEAGTGNANLKNIIKAMEQGFYKDRIFHRVIDGFMIQGGMDAKMSNREDAGFKAAKIESGNGLKNDRGTMAMARTSDPNSATTQFFINLKDNAFLNASPGNPGYTVVGKVSEGMDIVDKIAKVRTGNQGMHSDVPVTPVVIEAFTLDK
jgi:peptidyl-prolyl cis-trans isomerase A (cyclophilin A)